MKYYCLLITSLFAHFSFTQVSKGVATDSLPIAKNIDHTYSVYIPSSYSENKKWPIIYFFEPVGRGILPISLYSEIAEKYGLIMVSSNNSRNQIPMSESLRLAQELFDDTEERFNIDGDFVLTSGFSGGSRLAITLAGITSEIVGVIGVGAAEPVFGYRLPTSSNFLYVGLVGNQDMNYQEHRRIHEHFDEIGLRNWLIVSNLKHRWATPRDFELAFLWMRAQIDTSYSFEVEHLIMPRKEALMDSLSFVDQKIFLMGISNEKGSAELSKAEELAKRKDKRIRDSEMIIRKQVIDSLNKIIYALDQERTAFEWIKLKGREFKRKAENGKNLEQSSLYSRLFGFLTSYCYERMVSYYNVENYENVHVLIDILESMANSNPWIQWWRARAYSMQGDVVRCVETLTNLIPMGILNKSMLNNDPAFNSVRESEYFKELGEKLSE